MRWLIRFMDAITFMATIGNAIFVVLALREGLLWAAGFFLYGAFLGVIALMIPVRSISPNH